MAARLTDKQKKQIIADYTELGSYNATAKKNGVSRNTVKAIVTADEETARNCQRKKAQNTADILAHMEARRDKICEIIDAGLEALPDKIAGAKTATDVTTTLGILIDKFTAVPDKAGEDEAFELPRRVMGSAFVDIFRRIEPNRTYIFRGGRGGLKSSMISLLIVELMKNHPQMHACIVRKVAGTLKDSVYAQMQWAINELGRTAEFKFAKSPLEITYLPTGQKIYFRGVDEPTKLKGIKPVFGYIGILWKEELDQFAGPEEVRSVNQSVLRGGGESYDFSSFNPPKSRAAWVNHPEFLDGAVIHESNYLQAPPEWLGQKFLDDAAHLKDINPTAYEHEYMGVPNGDGGNVFEYVEQRMISDDELKSFDRIYQGVDWGWYPDQYAFLRCHYDAARERIYLLDELYVNKTANTETGAWIKEKGYTDAIITCDSAEPKSVNDYRDMGIPAFGAVKGPGSVDYGFKWLQRRTLVIDPARTPNALREVLAYEYMRDKDGNVISGYPDGNDHAISALRYAFEPLFRRRGSSA